MRYNFAVSRRLAICAAACAFALAAPRAQQEPIPTARLLPAPRLAMPGAIDSNVPMTWDLVDGQWRLFAFTSWGGIPALSSGTSLDRMQRVGDVSVEPHPGWGVWIESVIGDESSAWYGYYHHEIAAEICNTPVRSILRISAVRSLDRGLTWQDLGPVLEGPPNGIICTTPNAYVVGGVGDLTAMPDPGRQYLYLFFSQYSSDPEAQGVGVARLAWADRDEPGGKITVWREGAWVPTRPADASDGTSPEWEYPAGTPLVRPSKPWHGGADADAFWGPSVHWNTYLQRYVMLLNRTRDERFNNEGLYVSFARTLDDPRGWSSPRKIMNGGGWYPQVAGLEAHTGTDKLAGQRARFFITGRSEHYIDFRR
jgi:hypothetical protein